MKKTKSRNLLERLREREDDVLRFMSDPLVPYTNNVAEGLIRFLKVYLNISKCFRTLEHARKFAKRRSYIMTAKMNGMNATDAIACMLRGEIPFFMRE